MTPVTPWSRFLVDEDLPRSLAADLRLAGIDAEHVQDAHLNGKSDELVRALASETERIIVTRDVGMVSLPSSTGQHSPGFVLVRLPTSVSIAELKSTIVRALRSLTVTPPGAPVVVIEPGRIRIQRRPPA